MIWSMCVEFPLRLGSTVGIENCIVFIMHHTSTDPHTLRMMSQVKRRGGLLSVVVVVLLTIGGTSKTTVVQASIAPLASKPTLLVSKSTSLSTLSTEATSDGDDAVVTINETVVPRCGGDDEVTPLAHRLKVGGYFAVWYILNIIYNSKCAAHQSCFICWTFSMYSYTTCKLTRNMLGLPYSDLST